MKKILSILRNFSDHLVQVPGKKNRTEQNNLYLLNELSSNWSTSSQGLRFYKKGYGHSFWNNFLPWSTFKNAMIRINLWHYIQVRLRAFSEIENVIKKVRFFFIWVDEIRIPMKIMFQHVAAAFRSSGDQKIGKSALLFVKLVVLQ